MEESKEQDWDDSYVFRAARAHVYLAGTALSDLSLSSVSYVFGVHYLLEMMTLKKGMMMMVMVVTVEGDGDYCHNG